MNNMINVTYRSFIYLFFPIIVILNIFLIFISRNVFEKEVKSILIGVFFIFIILGVYCLLIFFNRKIIADDEQIIYISEFKKTYLYKKEEIENVRIVDYGRYTNSKIVIYANDGKRVVVPYHCRGYEELKDYFVSQGFIQ